MELTVSNVAILLGVVSVIVLLLGMATGFLISRKQFSSTIEQITLENNKIVAQYEDDKPTLEIDQRIKCTRELLILIDDTVALELINNKRYEIFLNTNVNNRDIDKDIEEIATNVFNSLRPEIFSDKNLVMTEDYLMKYVQKRTFVAVFTYVDKNVTDKLNEITQA